MFPEQCVRDMEAKLTKIALKDGAAVVQVKWTEAPGGANFITVATSSGLQVPRCTVTVPLLCPLSKPWDIHE